MATDHPSTLVSYWQHSGLCKKLGLWPVLASCLNNAQPFPAHCPAANNNSLIGCTGHNLTDDWSLASTHFVDGLCPFWCSFGCILFTEPDLFENNVPFNNTTPIYLINLLWKLGLGFRLDSELHYFSIFHRELRKVSTLSSANFTDGNILLSERTHAIIITYCRSARALANCLWPIFFVADMVAADMVCGQYGLPQKSYVESGNSSNVVITKSQAQNN